MYAAIAFALLTVASAVEYGSYSSYGGYGVNPIAQQYPVQALSHNAAAIQYAAPIQKVVAPYGASVYGAQKVVAPFNVAAYGAQKVYSAPQAYAYDNAQVQRDYDIEGLGERYSIQNGPNSFQYSFVRGADVAPHGYAQKVVAPVAYGVPHHARVQAAHPYGYGAQLRVNPTVVKQLIK